MFIERFFTHKNGRTVLLPSIVGAIGSIFFYVKDEEESMAEKKKARKKTEVVHPLNLTPPEDVKVSGVFFTEVQQLQRKVESYETVQLSCRDLLGNLRDYLEGTSHEALYRTETMIALTDAVLKLLGDE